MVGDTDPVKHQGMFGETGQELWMEDSTELIQKHLLRLRREPQGFVFDFPAEVVRLVGLEHPYLPSEDEML